MKDDEYKYEYNNTCLKKCPPNTKIYVEEMKCKNECDLMQLEYDKKCYNNCSLINDERKIICDYGIKYLTNNSLYFLDEVMKNIQDDSINLYNTSGIDNGSDEIIKVGEVTYTLTKTKNQKDQINDNVTTIDLGKCEEGLKKIYNISQDDNLYIFKIDYYIESILKVEYEVYYNFSTNNLTKLDLNYCKDIKIDILIPKDIPFNEIDKYNQSSGLYNDICYTLISDSGKDKSLNDRRDEFKKNNLSVCGENCDFTQYNNVSKKAVCSCSTVVELALISQISVDKNKLFSNFKDIRYIGNFKMLSCLKLFLKQKDLFKNSANYMLVILFILSFLSILIFTFHDKKMIKRYL